MAKLGYRDDLADADADLIDALFLVDQEIIKLETQRTRK
jgi:hypothetical protein